MLKKRKWPSRLRLSYILSYMLIFIVPFTIMSFIFYYNSVGSLREETERSSINNLNTIKNTIDGRMKELGEIGALISLDPTLTGYRVSNQEFRSIAIDELKKYQQNSSIINELYLYYFNQEDMFTGDGHMSVDTFLEYRSSIPLSEKQDFLNTLQDVNYPKIYTNANVFEHHPVFLYPLPPGPVQPYGVVFMKLDESFFDQMIDNILGGYEGNVFIFDQNDHLIATTNHKSDMKADHITPFLGSDNNISELDVDKVHYSIVKVKSETSHWSYVTALPTKQFFSKVSEFQTFMLLIFLFIALFASLAAIYIALKQYVPIQKMIDTVKRKDESLRFNDKRDLHSLSDVIENLYVRNEDLTYQYGMQQPMIRDQFLIAMVQGHSSAIKQPSELMESLQLDFKGNASFVFVTSLPSDDLSELDLKELEIAAGRLATDASLYSVVLIHDKLIVYILNGDFKKVKDKKDFLVLFRKLLEDYGVVSNIGVGEAYKENLNRSFIEATAALEYGNAQQLAGIIHFDEIVSKQEAMWLPKTELLKLTQSCKQGNFDMARETILSLLAWLQEKKTPNQFLKHLQYDILNTLLKIASETSISVHVQKDYYHLDTLSFDQFEKNVIELTREICAEISNKKENQKTKLQDDLLTYIHKHFQEYDFSLEKMAVHFNLSSSYLSRFIKEETKFTFSQYVWELRLTEVKKQLTETKSSIKDIIANVGYIDAPNFTRKFKNSVGMTPTEYREIHSKAQ